MELNTGDIFVFHLVHSPILIVNVKITCAKLGVFIFIKKTKKTLPTFVLSSFYLLCPAQLEHLDSDVRAFVLFLLDHIVDILNRLNVKNNLFANFDQ